MLKECLEVFQKVLEDKKTIILDTYILSPSLYVRLEPDNDSFKIKNINQITNKNTNKNTNENTNKNSSTDKDYKDLKHYDYFSNLISTNKMISDKKILSNNYMAFFVKVKNILNTETQKPELTDDKIDGYYNALKKNLSTSSTEQDIEMLEKIRKWVKGNIKGFVKECEKEGYKLKKTDEIKLFFEHQTDTKIKIEIEGNRYVDAKKFNTNKKNKEDDIGIPCININLNSDKPYLKNKSRKNETPYLVNGEEAFLEIKFFDYLTNIYNRGEQSIYINTDKYSIETYPAGQTPKEGFKGIFLNIGYEKKYGVIIQDYEVLSNFQYLLKKKFKYENILYADLDINKKDETAYKITNNIYEVQEIIDKIYFRGKLVKNYFTDAKMIRDVSIVLKNNILYARKQIYNWISKGNISGIPELLHTISISFIQDAITTEQCGLIIMDQLNLRWSLHYYFGRGVHMGMLIEKIAVDLRSKINDKQDLEIESDQEFYYGVGQLAKFLLSLSNESKAKQSRINPILNSINEKALKMYIYRLYIKYNSGIEDPSFRFDNLYRMINVYHPNGRVDKDFLLAGYFSASLIYEKKKEEK